MSRAPIRRPSSSRRGWLVHQQHAGAPLALLGNEADPTGFHLDAAHYAWQNDACSIGLATLSLAVKDQGWW
jgi:hypothetical protein